DTRQGSNYGYNVDISAPGTYLLTTDDDNKYYKIFGGTSFAAPVISAAAALVWDKFPHYTAEQIAERLRLGSHTIYHIPYNSPYKNKLGAGRVNIYNSLIDSISPALRFLSVQVTDLNDNIFRAAETLYITGNFVNYCNSVKNISVGFTSENEFAAVENGLFSIPAIKELDTVSNKSEPFIVTLSKNLPFDVILVFRITYYSGNSSIFEYIKIPVNPSFVTLKNKNLEISLSANGTIGFMKNQQFGGGVGIKYLNKQSIYDSGLNIGLSADSTISCFRSSNTFSLKKNARIIHSSNPDVVIAQAQYTDEQLNGQKYLNIEIINTLTLSKKSDWAISEYKIINKNPYPLQNLFAGNFIDWEIDNYLYNIVTYDSNTAYISSSEPGSSIVGQKVLSYTSKARNFTIYKNPNDTVPLNPFKDFSSKDHFYCLTQDNSSKPYSGFGADLYHHVSIGSFDVKSGDTLIFAFSLSFSFQKDSVDILTKQAETYFYNLYPKLKPQETEARLKYENVKTFIYPTIGNNTNITVSSSENIQCVYILNQTGAIQLTYTVLDENIQKCIIPVYTLKKGLYFVAVITSGGYSHHKLIILPK
ncbi:MAG: S8 family peptidase, partial [Bacteroidales bacterium]